MPWEGHWQSPRVYDGHNRSFFFGSMETTRGSQALSNLNPTVALAAWREGDFSREATAIVDPFRQPRAVSRRTPACVAHQFRLSTLPHPLPNFGDTRLLRSQNFGTQLQRAFDPNTYVTGRLDHRFSQPHSQPHFIFGRYIWNRSHSRDFDSGLPACGQRWQRRKTRAVNTSNT